MLIFTVKLTSDTHTHIHIQTNKNIYHILIDLHRHSHTLSSTLFGYEIAFTNSLFYMSQSPFDPAHHIFTYQL